MLKNKLHIITSLTSFLTFIILFFSFGYFTNIYAQTEFAVDSNIEYKLDENGITHVTQNTTLENLYPTIYATSYTLNLENIEPINLRAFQDGQELDVEETRKDNVIIIRVNFPDTLLGKGKSRNFIVSFDVSDFATRTGEVWEISIPKLSESENFRDFTKVLLIPESFGNKAYISPDPKEESFENGYYKYIYEKEQISDSSIQAGFGKFQVFSFVLNYHIENPLNQNAETSIPLPPDTAFQKIYYENIEPKPDRIEMDQDGNWMAFYKLKQRERIDVKAVGSVKIFSKEQQYLIPSEEVLLSNLAESKYWQVNDDYIKGIANTLSTPEDIYNYVVETLSYDYERVRPNVQRMGAVSALSNPSASICMEFTDLFITLTRASGIPAREVNGYAYTENPEIQPLSLVADVLHSWPEYYDKERSAWIAVDPTWGNTTKGIDYFNKLDLRHFTFVIHGTDPEKPYAPGSYKLGPNPQKDVYVNFGKLPVIQEENLELTAQVSKKFPYINSNIYVNVENHGPTALYNVKPVAYFDEEKIELNEIEFLPPFSNYEIVIKVPFSFLGINTPNVVVLEVNGSKVDIPSYKSMVIINSLVVLFVILLIIILILLFKFKKIKLPRFKKKKTLDENTQNTQIDKGPKEGDQKTS